MYFSLRQRSRLTCFTAVLCLMSIDVCSAQEKTLRWFAIDQAADLESVLSRRLVARNDSGPGDPVVEQFGSFNPSGGGGPYYAAEFMLRDSEGNLLLDLSDTVWTRLPVLHITEEGVEQYSSTYWLWKNETKQPGPGMTAKTGADGEAVKYVTFGISRIPAGNGTNSGKLYIAPDSPTKLTLHLAPFNK